MTLVLAVTTPKSLWLLTDRRLSFKDRPPLDTAVKTFRLSTTDGEALIGYAGLGSTAADQEPSDWMSRVLRGRGLTLEQSLGVIADAMKTHLAPHLLSLAWAGHTVAHTVIAAAIVSGAPRLYTIDMVRDTRTSSGHFRFTRVSMRFPHEHGVEEEMRVCFGGSGGRLLASKAFGKRWARDLQKVVAAFDDGLIGWKPVAETLARLTKRVHANTSSVSESCIVTWYAPAVGGGHASYPAGGDRVTLPSIGVGHDLKQVSEIFFRSMQKRGADDTRTTSERMMVGVEEMIKAMNNQKPDPTLK